MKDDDVKRLLKHMSDDVKALNADEIRAIDKKLSGSVLERRWQMWWNALTPHIPLVAEYRFHPTRKWRFDFAHVKSKVAIELEGGVYSFGRHQRAAGFLEDMDKYNAALELGWRVFRYGTGQVGEEAVYAVYRAISGKNPEACAIESSAETRKALNSLGEGSKSGRLFRPVGGRRSKRTGKRTGK
jgi:very-short-patch-repair endonuclease